MIQGLNGQRWLTHPGERGVTPPCGDKERLHYRDQCKALTGGTRLPTVLYKGTVIEERLF